MSNMMWAELQQPVYPVEYNNTINSHKLKYQSKPKAINHPYMQQHPSHTSNNKKEREEQQLQKPSSPKISTKRKSQSSKYIEDDEKRKNFLERNRQGNGSYTKINYSLYILLI